MSPTPPPPSPASPASPEPPAPFHPNLLTKDFIVLPATARVLPPVPHLAPKSDIKLSARMFVDPSVGEGGVDIVGLHANGISKACYYPLISHLFHLLPFLRSIILYDARTQGDSAVLNAGLLPEPPVEGWNFAKDGVDDLFGLMKAFKLDEKKRNVIGLGHSMGGATLLLAQIKYPGLFASLVLLEPILYPYLPPPPPNQKTTAQLAASRRSTFPSLDSARASFASKPFFASWHPAALDLYVSHGFHKTPDGWTLKTTPGWESAAFTGGIHGKWGWPRLPELTCPVSIITARGSSHALLRYPNASGEVVTKDLAIASFLPHATHEWVEGSHMFPLERPGAVAKLVAGYVGKSMDREYYEEKSRGPEMGMNERGMDGGMGGMDGGLGGGMGGMDGGMGMGGGMDGLGPGTDSFLGDLDNEGGESWDEEFGRGRL